MAAVDSHSLPRVEAKTFHPLTMATPDSMVNVGLLVINGQSLNRLSSLLVNAASAVRNRLYVRLVFSHFAISIRVFEKCLVASKSILYIFIFDGID